MVIDPTKPADGVPAVKLDLRNNLAAAKSQIEALQVGKSDLGHQHVLADITDAGTLASKSSVQAGDVAPAAIVTAALADGAVTEAKIAADAVGASQLQAGIPIDMQDQQLTRAQLKDFSETSTTPSTSSGSLTLDLETGNVFEVTLTENVTTLTFAHPPAAGRAGSLTVILVQDAIGSWTVAWPSSVRWPGGEPIAISGAANAVDVLAFVTRDGGATWYGFLGGKDFS